MKIITLLLLTAYLSATSVLAQPAAPVITLIEKNPYGYNIKFTMEKNTTYQVQVCSSMNQPWTVVLEINSGDFSGIGTTLIPTASLPSPNQGFIRVFVRPPT
jgi:hypothetical protein